MIAGIEIKELILNKDDRGWLAEIFRDDEADYKPAMAYLSLTNPGVIRGPHEHKHQSDYFIFAGPGDFEVYLWDNREDSNTYGEAITIHAGAMRPLSLIVPPGVVHGYKCVSEVPALSFNLPDKLYRGAKKSAEVDEIRWENDTNSPYKIV